MNLSGRPLLDNAVDQALFTARDDALRRIERSLRSELNCLVVGDPGSGKTSLVRALMYRSHRVGASPGFTYVRGNGAHTAADLLVDILTVRSRGAGSDNLPTDPIELVDRLVDEFAESPDGRSPRVIVLEDVPPTPGLELFGALRDELWQVKATWLVTTSTAHSTALLRPPADVFFETTVQLEPLTADEVTDLLRRRLGQPATDANEALIRAVVPADPGTPRRALEVARELSAEPAVGGRGLTTAEGSRARAAALEQVSRPARMLAQELESTGWASASDERLLDRMGWTRPRVVQVIGELLSRGLVQMREERTGRGRPRKLYRLTPAAEFVGGVAP